MIILPMRPVSASRYTAEKRWCFVSDVRPEPSYAFLTAWLLRASLTAALPFTFLICEMGLLWYRPHSCETVCKTLRAVSGRRAANGRGGAVVPKLGSPPLPSVLQSPDYFFREFPAPFFLWALHTIQAS